MRFKFTDTEIKKALKNLTIIVDSREKGNQHILKWFDANKIKYKIQALEHGDYSAFIPKGELKGVDRDIYFDKDIVIEKKASIDELAGNFSKADTPRLKSEFAHLCKNNTRVFLFIENQLFDRHIRNGKYRSQYDSKTLYARIKGLEAEYNTIVRPVDDEYIASEIYNTLYYQIRSILLRDFEITKE